MHFSTTHRNIALLTVQALWLASCSDSATPPLEQADSQGQPGNLAPPEADQTQGIVVFTEGPFSDTAVVGLGLKTKEYPAGPSSFGAGRGPTGGGRYARRDGGRIAESGESYGEVAASAFMDVGVAPSSSFAADVDTASWANVRRILSSGALPPEDAVRLEEFVNAFRYRVAGPTGHDAFAVQAEVAPCPWQPEHHLARLCIKTREIEASRVPPCNLVFLIDVSGSMRSRNKLPLLVRGMRLLVDQLRPQDSVSIVTYAAGVNVVLEGATGADKDKIKEILGNLEAGGGTDGEGGIRRAYQLARQHRVQGVNRVLLATDGDFNVGISEVEELHKFIAEQKQDNVFLTVLGFGAGNLRDDRLETLANRGNGIYAYIDRLAEARRVLVEQFGASMMTVAKDVKLQVEFDPRLVAGYRLLGYENRKLTNADYHDDKKDGGELGAGHAVTALYQIVPRGQRLPGADDEGAEFVDASNQQGRNAAKLAKGPLLELRVRYKPPQGDKSREITYPIELPAQQGPVSRDSRLAAAAAAFAMLLRGDETSDDLSWEQLDKMVAQLDEKNDGVHDRDVAELRRLVGLAAGIRNASSAEK